MINENCSVCRYGADLIDWENLSNYAVAEIVNCSESSVRRHKKHAEDPELVVGEKPEDKPGGSWVPRRRWDKADGSEGMSWQWVADPTLEVAVPAWPVIDRPAPLPSPVSVAPSLVRKWKTAVAGADTQIGFRRLDDGTMDPFHDDAAMALFNAIVEGENPDQVILAGDILDLPEQGRYAQELAFAGTTQKAIDRTYTWLHDMRSKTAGAIHLIEGNHDKRLQNFVETNAVSAFGLKRAGWPDEWPVMSIPYLLRLDELNVNYYDAYPNAHVWINDILRAEHGTKANSNGSTAEKYLKETPHISRIIGHSHRQEVVQRTTWDRMGKIKSQVINPGCLCRVDGAVPSVHGSVGASGRPATVYEDWQQGAAIIRYTDDQFFSELVQFDDGTMMYQGSEYSA